MTSLPGEAQAPVANVWPGLPCVSCCRGPVESASTGCASAQPFWFLRAQDAPRSPNDGFFVVFMLDSEHHVNVSAMMMEVPWALRGPALLCCIASVSSQCLGVQFGGAYWPLGSSSVRLSRAEWLWVEALAPRCEVAGALLQCALGPGF